MKRVSRAALLGLASFGLATVFSPAGVQAAVVITQFNFNSNPADANTSTGLTTPSIGSGTYATIGGITPTFSTGSPADPAPSADNSGSNTTGYPSQGTGSGTAGIKVTASTVGATDIVISQDFRQSGTASRFFQLLVSSDGTTFNAPTGGTATFTSSPSPNTATTFSSTGLYSNNSGGGTQAFVQGISYQLPSGSEFENNPNFAYEWVSVFDPSSGTNYISSNAGTTAAYATSGTARFDLVTVSGTTVPEPAAMLTLSGVAVVALRKRR